MTDPDSAFVDASQPPGTLPIFPLPGVVLFPNMALPLHIFEDRYKKLTAACLEGNRLLAVPMLKVGWERGDAPEAWDLSRRVVERFRQLATDAPARSAPLLGPLALLASPVDILAFAAANYAGLSPEERQGLLEELHVPTALSQFLRFLQRDAARFN